MRSWKGRDERKQKKKRRIVGIEIERMESSFPFPIDESLLSYRMFECRDIDRNVKEKRGNLLDEDPRMEIEVDRLVLSLPTKFPRWFQMRFHPKEPDQ